MILGACGRSAVVWKLNGSRQSLDSSRAFCFEVVDLFLYGLFDDGLFFDW